MCQRLSAWLVLRCREASFQQFLGVDSEGEAAEKVRVLCGVSSRGEIDRSPEAAQRFHELVRQPYNDFYHHHTQEHVCSKSQ